MPSDKPRSSKRPGRGVPPSAPAAPRGSAPPSAPPASARPASAPPGAAPATVPGVPASVGRWVAYYRERAGRSQAELSRLTGVPQSTISLIEATGNARADTLQQLAPGLGVPVGALFGEAAAGLTSDEAALVHDYRQLAADARAALRAYVGFLRATPGSVAPRPGPAAVG